MSKIIFRCRKCGSIKKDVHLTGCRKCKGKEFDAIDSSDMRKKALEIVHGAVI